MKRPAVNGKVFLALQLSLLFSSLSGVASKMAARQTFLSLPFCFYYGLVLLIMVGYAFVWQQILHYLPLTFAYGKQRSLLSLGHDLGRTLFSEKITWNMILGAAVIFFGIYLVVTSNE